MKHNNRKLLLLTIIIIIQSFGFGCLGNSGPEPIDLPAGAIDSYEINVFRDNVTNSTTFFLFSNKTVRAVTTFTNSSSLEIIVPKDASAEFRSKKGPVITDLVVKDNIANISYTSAISKSGNKRKVMLEFEEPVTGFAAYTFSWEYGQFHHFLSRNETITVILPPGHNTGNIILGSPKPTSPDEKFRDNKDRVGLIWLEPYANHNYISVKYYKDFLPTILSILGLVLLIGFLVTAFYYNNKIRKLQEKRNAIESDIRKKN